MKNIELKFAKCLKLAVLTVVMLGAGVFTTNVRAQTARTFEIQVPFDFVVKGRTYKSGIYHIERLNEANPDTLVLKNTDGKKSLILQTQRLNSGTSIKLSKLTFSRYGEMYFLDSIRASGESYESYLPFAKSDRRRLGSVQLAEIVSITKK